ncbi:SAM-dependent methyltransferase [Marinitenerispora sediminis]|uniref:S-adenosyl-L-methionine-dependent methyltransferase n=1 Tax=Marinitenerispora sediminis TaxID=1931232 RepID=A0A368T2Z3_9ACTN|nr:SAM-dependent methyltransferase [Marinitenerispora sediminis]RCV51917.1 SAM-dependent methyltransferase [Marinitenerispora sediminis]RCV55747.1 SAM-dependent methyltransferase [Marinitenerispora sediminis]
MTTPTAGVSTTALVIASARATESERADRLFRDPLAAGFLAAATGEGPVPALETVRHPMEHYFAIRTRLFDDYLLRACARGCGQVVVLGAGLDTRAFRLPWPAGVRLFELDLPHVFGFKEPVVAAAGAVPACERVTVPADLGGDWAAALRAAGLRPDLPTAWLIEGVLCYLDSAQAERVLAEATRLSAPGSWIAGEHVSRRVFDDPVARPMLDALAAVDAAWRSGVDDVVPWLGGYGWRAETVDLTDPAVHHGRLSELDRERIGDGPPRGWIFRAAR